MFRYSCMIRRGIGVLLFVREEEMEEEAEDENYPEDKTANNNRI